MNRVDGAPDVETDPAGYENQDEENQGNGSEMDHDLLLAARAPRFDDEMKAKTLAESSKQKIRKRGSDELLAL